MEWQDEWRCGSLGEVEVGGDVAELGGDLAYVGAGVGSTVGAWVESLAA
jgi:hypothetical protein